MERYPYRVLAIDWSGAKRQGGRKIWLAEVRDGGLVRLENGKDREQIAGLLISEAERDDRFVVGVDFAFSFPSWFCKTLKATTAYDVWEQAGSLGWLNRCGR